MEISLKGIKEEREDYDSLYYSSDEQPSDHCRFHFFTTCKSGILRLFRLASLCKNKN
jgi:hypothetical protein